MLKDVFGNIAQTQGWEFEYAPSDITNLLDELDDKILLAVDPIEIGKNRNDTGQVESISYSGSFLLLKSSSINEESYNDRYDKYIKIATQELEELEESLICQHQATLDNWKITEVINVLDWNGDGLMINYKVTIDED